MKSLVCLLLAFVLLLGLTACKKSELKVDGGDMYYYSSEETSAISSVDTSSDEEVSSNNTTSIDYTSTVSTKRPTTDWDEVIDGSEPYYFTIKNSMDVNIKRVGYRPAGYKDYRMFDLPIKVGESAQVSFSQGETAIYDTFEFIFVNEEGRSAELNPLVVNNKKGLELIYVQNGGYSYEYIK